MEHTGDEQTAQGLDLCLSEPFMSNMKAISLDAIRNRTKYLVKASFENLMWFRCKYCSVKIRCRRDDDEDDPEFETWTSTVFGSHSGHPPGCKVLPLKCYLEVVVRQNLANGLSGKILAGAVQQFFGYEINTRAIYYVEHMASGRQQSSKQWKKLPGLVKQLQSAGTNSRVHIDADGVLQRAYIELKTVQLLRSPAFIGVLFVDGCHCKDKLQSTLCVACTLTGDHIIIPLAFVLGQGETKDNYLFLFSSLKHAIPQNATIFSDESQALLSAVSEVLTEKHCRTKACAFHLLKKLQVNRKRFYQMLKSDNQEQLRRRLSEMITDFPNCREKLIEYANKYAYMGPQYVNAFGMVSDSPVESCNAAIEKWRRKEPVDMVIGLIQWGNKQVADQLRKLTGQYCTTCKNLTEYRKRFGDALAVTQNKDQTWTVIEWFKDGQATYVVSRNGHALICSCQGYERDGIPCRHLLVLEDRGTLLAPEPMDYYRSAEIRQALHGTEIVLDPSKITDEDVKEPEKRTKTGRPPTRRYKSVTERLLAARRRSYRCAICKRQGHTSKTHDAWERRQRKRQAGGPIVNQTLERSTSQKGRTFKFDIDAFQKEQERLAQEAARRRRMVHNRKGRRRTPKRKTK